MQQKLQNLIQTNQDINFLVENIGGFETEYDVSMGQVSNDAASPLGRQHTSTTRTLPDLLNINGWIRTVICGADIIDTTDYLKRMKQVIEAQKYTVDELATITNADGVFQNMLLRNINWRRSGRSPQEILVSMSWESMNFSGEIDNPFFTIGGLTA